MKLLHFKIIFYITLTVFAIIIAWLAKDIIKTKFLVSIGIIIGVVLCHIFSNNNSLSKK